MIRFFLALLLIVLSGATHAQVVVPGAASTAVEGSHIFKIAGGTLWSGSITVGASAGFWMIFDSATVPADGAVTPMYCWQVAANTSLGASWPAGARFGSGITMAFSTGANCVTKTVSATGFFMAQVQ